MLMQIWYKRAGFSNKHIRYVERAWLIDRVVIQSWQLIMWFSSVHCPLCLYILLTTSGHAPDDLGHVLPHWIRASMSTWAVCRATWERGMHRYIMSHRWLRIKVCCGAAYTLWQQKARIVLHQEEPRAHCTRVQSDYSVGSISCLCLVSIFEGLFGELILLLTANMLGGWASP